MKKGTTHDYGNKQKLKTGEPQECLDIDQKLVLWFWHYKTGIVITEFVLKNFK